MDNRPRGGPANGRGSSLGGCPEPRRPQDWATDRAAAAPAEARPRALTEPPLVTPVADFTEEFDAPDFAFRFEREPVRLELKLKGQPLSQEFRDLWPEVDERQLVVIDEVSFRRLVQLCLGPQRRFQRREEKGGASS